jgi:hypothetical protein
MIVPAVGAAGVVFTTIDTLPVISCAHEVEILVAVTVYIPARVWFPKEMAEPVPETAVPRFEPFSLSWYDTPV